MLSDEAVFGYPRDFLANQFVYLVVSPRARGLSVGVNLNPVVNCAFNCMYCEVDRTKPSRALQSDAQIYSATRPMARLGCGHLPLRTLGRIAETVREVTGLRAEVF